jgi:hypothetical protein
MSDAKKYFLEFSINVWGLFYHCQWGGWQKISTLKILLAILHLKSLKIINL